MPSAVHRSTVMRLAVTDEHALPVLVHLDFDAADPFAVRLSCHLVGEEPAHWVFARELLAIGLTRTAGAGEVRIRPRRDHVEFRLGPTEACAVLCAQVAPLAGFVTAVGRLVRAAREGVADDLDRVLASILGWSALPDPRHRPGVG